MLPTPLRARQKRHQQTIDAAKAYQHESPPAAGHYPHTSASDSQHQDQETSDEGGSRGDNFGVESMSEWGSYMSSVKQAQRDDTLGGGRSHAAGGRDVSPISTEGLVFHRSDAADGDSNEQSSGQVEPPSPEETLHPLEPIDPVDPSPSSHPPPLPFHSHLRLADLPPPGTPPSPSIPGSEPGSPMSLASMPSYVASMSSMSRTSSVNSPIHDHDETQGGSFRAEGDGGDRGLVLPQLNLPSESLSLHLSLPRWLNSWSSDDDHNQPHNKRGPITLALVGEREEAERLLREVKERVEMVKLDNGVGVLQNGKIGIRIVSGLKLAEVQKSIHQAYQTLNALLSPVPLPSTEMESELKRLIDGYASREDWIHGVIVLGEVDKTSLDKMIPTITLSAPSASPEISHETPHPKNHAMPESTPKPTEAGLSYFTLPAHEEQPESDEESVAPSDLEHSPSISDSILPKLSPKAEVLLSSFASPRNLAERSTTSFLAWRRSPYLSTTTSSRASYPTSPSPSASSYYAGAMPTVARAQGGGEWEATLSRRVAQRRESGDAVMSKSGKELLKVKEQRKRRRSIDKGTGRGDYYQALFPRVSPGNTGKKDTMSSIIRKALAEWKGRLFPGTSAGAGSGGKGGEGGKDSRRRIWKWGVVAGAVFVLGWGVWLGVKS